MTMYIHIDGIYTEIGSSDFLHAFFSTISGNLEPKGWGTRFPELILKLYCKGKLNHKKAKAALSELKIIKNELKLLSPQQVIWDIDDRSKIPPWGNDISNNITDLSNYFVTSTGRDLFDAIEENLEESHEANEPVSIEDVNFDGTSGNRDFLKAFFSTISGNLEPEGWGTRFPLMRKLYQGKLSSKKSKAALSELKIIKNELKLLAPQQVIWDIDDRSKMPPWGDDISDDITDLSNYFVTSGGHDLIEAIKETLEASNKANEPVSIEQFL